MANRSTKKKWSLSPCVICKEIPTDRAHIKTRGAGATWEWWEWMPLCRQHHQIQGQIGWKNMSNRFIIIGEILKQMGWYFQNNFGVWKIRHKGKGFKNEHSSTDES